MNMDLTTDYQQRLTAVSPAERSDVRQSIILEIRGMAAPFDQLLASRAILAAVRSLPAAADLRCRCLVLRRKLHFLQCDMARELGMSLPSYRNIEQGKKTKLKPQHLLRLRALESAPVDQ